ncbi:MAG TPA: decarboxylating NADP(+)-dependent phosphogluconate dehydrogenase [Bacteroidales bacterium]|jgi:6-phosphogluconate dehydrogenase|nr:decarboxylating NADP(+)-dependent phosphogluconate dehydrogenase [Bacteroidales bacterium]HOT18074.1 decarboxylating NADP(+)-dependent phosphogluconate dehydrogenase [Bacteroidales bacterium]HQI11457.1 decarboxylating NADP(+)-dependent phosphogluconate dehydrogenase [Bacteroidales bacterium]HQJ14685.1 decarboxylating NADP(+)-dependent phosphogluconate dehydrogenase [Bacteroidales bacterium]
MKADIGLIGLAVMGENLVLNMESRGYTVAVFNRTTEKVSAFVNGRGKGKKLIPAYSPGEFIASLSRPRKVMLMVKAGKPVDDFIELLIPLLDKGDIIIEGGNSHFPDTIRRTAYVESKGLLYIGTGVSGGEEGALLGPSLMPGGSVEAWPHVKDIFHSIAARASDGAPCVTWIGDNGAGHFVKMAHNGIEYGDMQLICEAYHLMLSSGAFTYDEMADIFDGWNKGELDSFLIQITGEILRFRDTDGQPLVTRILDSAGQKGTGKWTVISALDHGVPLSLIGESVFARFISAMKKERVKASPLFNNPAGVTIRDKKQFVDDIRRALYASKIVSYAQGFNLLRNAAAEYKWNLNYGEIAMIWRGGCIIRSAFLNKIYEAFSREPGLPNLITDEYFTGILRENSDSWRRVVAHAVATGIPVPAMSSALAWFDSYRSEWLPANLLQAQRDYFGAHTYQRTDKPEGEFFHTNWTGRGGDTASSTYNA